MAANLKVSLVNHLGVTINGIVYIKKGSTLKTHSTAGGTYQFNNISPGDWVVTAKTSSGFRGGPVVKTVIDGQTTMLTVQVFPQEEDGITEVSYIPSSCPPCPPCPPYSTRSARYPSARLRGRINTIYETEESKSMRKALVYGIIFTGIVIAGAFIVTAGRK